jgi:hypothetical protein
MLKKRAVLVGMLLSCVVSWVAAQTLDVRSHISIAPLSIPIHPTAGATGVGMVRLGVKPLDSGETSSISQITVSLTSDGSFDPVDISDIRVYFEIPGNSEYDNGANIDDVEVDMGGVHTFTGTSATIPINPADPGGATFGFAGGDKWLYVVFDFSSGADTTTNVGCEVTSVTYGAAGVGTGTTLAVGGADPQFILHNQRRNADTLEATMDASWIGPATAAANASKVGLLRLDFDALDSTVNATTAPVQLDKVRVHLTFGQDNWVGTAGVLLYADDGDGLFEPDADDGTYVASATLSGGYALLDPANIPITSAGKTYFVAVNLNGAAAQVGQSFGLNINDPSVDIIFADEIDDDAIGNAADPEYAYLVYTAAGTWEYVQKGYAVSTTADPAAIAGNTFLINPADDGNPPSVATTVPLDGATGASRNADITVVFNEYMTESSVEDPANFTLSGGITPSSFIYTPATQTLVIALPVLAWGTTYTATVEGTVQDFYGNAMGSDYTWTFTVEPAVNPTVLAVVPEEDATDMPIEAATTTIRATFSEPLEATTVGAGDLTLALANAPFTAVAGTVSYDPGTQTVMLTLGADLQNDMLYRATVPAGSVTDEDDLPLLAEKTWTFRTIRLYPPFTEPVIIKNRIVTGGNQQALVFVTQPPAGPADRVSVQVFTNTGRRVATLVDNLPFTSISSPILWDGTNGKGQPLGPGLYYVQIRATNYKRVLKVLIVR